MNTPWRAFFLTGALIVTLLFTRNLYLTNHSVGSSQSFLSKTLPQTQESLYAASLTDVAHERVSVLPIRKWDVLDPALSSEAVLLQSLDDSFPFYHQETYKSWPTASLAKLMTAVVVFEQIGFSKNIPITERAVATEGVAGGLQIGEIYSSEDLLKIMLLSSSNDAAVAFEDFLGGTEMFVSFMNKKAMELGMTRTMFQGASGLSNLSFSTASDMLRLAKYILQEHPDIFNWTRLHNFLVQPTNGTESKTIYNINPFVSDEGFLGGKTGTSPGARENLLAFFTFQDTRVVMILLGSRNRVLDAKRLMEWTENAYIF
ncbi:hypothetical protein A3A21_03610 [Candidatus Jorgensenbacteria bacterium RIFCSPLOWO2_01_FULL_45_25b]|uniref:Peptidase S11 D-alanyl-D-alanine carboxypeptidase A N-terminal domain-containing protein n=1 Tax=Candidatus Jorgensenbacteria bacterium RIFCSPLOWO2_01_FULL_45_25b TaxID=1798471 RepID=A0A1F6BY74_9BACT|nr:MAG: hypothetical protein A3A21_03610 [Candidatus Jorgensenbacteria bacterium RIFCSPLOWO2_01_FULL_45_25b]